LTLTAKTKRIRRHRATALCALIALTAAGGCTTSTQGSAYHSAPGHYQMGHKATSRVDKQVRRTVLLGHSVDGRAITATEIGDPDSPAHTLIVGCVHGSEPAGIAITKALAAGPGPSEAALWMIADLNPDGVAAGTRDNAHGVDLNRNFPNRWKPLGPPGSLYYAGPRPLSEPESKLAAALVQLLRPRLTIYYHQHLDVVDDSQGPRSIERRYAHAAGLPLYSLTDYPGSAVGWQNHLLGATAFIVELPAKALSRQHVQAHVNALMTVLPRA
jgi:protein MpaA